MITGWPIIKGSALVSPISGVMVLQRCFTVFQKLLRCGCCKAIDDALSRRNYLMSDVGIPEIWHFIYKSRSTSQLTSPDYSAPYATVEEQTRLFATYQWVHSRMHSPARTLKILYHVGKYESVLGWVSVLLFELFMPLPPLIGNGDIMSSHVSVASWRCR